MLLFGLMPVFMLTACGGKNSDRWDWKEEYVEADEEDAEAFAKEETPAETETPAEMEKAPAEAAPALKEEELEAYYRIMDELDQYMRDEDLEGLFSAYNGYKEAYPTLSGKLEERKAMYVEQIKKVFDDWIAEADELVVSGDWQGGKEKFNDIARIKNMKDHFEELDAYSAITEERLSYYADYNRFVQPTGLMGKEFDMGDGCYYRDKDWGKNIKYEDRYGGSYDEYYELVVIQANMQNHRPYVTFNADGKYERFNAYFSCHKGMTEDKQFYIEVYGDDTLLYTSDSFTSYTEPMNIEVDITGYKLIKFVAVREDHNLSYATDQPSVGIYMASFSHTETPEFEYYIPQSLEADG